VRVSFAPEGTYTVTYLGNGQDTGSPPVDTGQYMAGTWVFILGNSGNMSRTGHVFTGWNDEADGSGRDYVPGRTFEITGDVTLYAQWEETDLRTLYLPHIDGTEGWRTQVALVNAGHDPAQADLTVVNSAGDVVTECPVELPPGSREEYLSGVDDCLPAIKGYARIETYSEDVTGFTRFARQDNTYRMSLPLRAAYGAESVFIPYVQSNEDGWETSFGLANPSQNPVTVELSFLGESGDPESHSVTLAAGEQRIVSVSEFYANEPQEWVETARISNVGGLVGYFMLRNDTIQQLDGTAFTPSGDSLLIPHIYNHDEDEWTTILVFANPSQEQDAVLTLSGYSKDEGFVGEYAVTLPAGQRMFGYPDAFNLPDNVAWASVSSTIPVAGMVQYIVTPEHDQQRYVQSRTASEFLRQLASGGEANMAIIPVVNITSSGGVFPILDQTGKMDVSIVNTSEHPAFMTLEAMDADGNIVIRTDRYLRGHAKLWADSAGVLMKKPGEEEVDMTGVRYIRYASTGPMSGLQLNGSADPMRDSTMLDSLVAQAYPLQDEYALTLEKGERSGMFPFGRRVNISADIPTQGQIFKQWTGDTWSLDRVENIYNPNTIVIMPAGPVTVTAEYYRKDPTRYNLTVESGRPSGDYTAGRLIPVRAEDKPDLFFSKWIGTGAKFLTRVNVPSPQALMPKQDIVIEATYTDTLPESRELELINGRPSGKTTHPAGRAVRIFADLPPTFEQMFDKWEGDVDAVANVNMSETRLTMPDEDIFIEATYKEIPDGEFTVTVQTSLSEEASRVQPAALQRLMSSQAVYKAKPGEWVELEAPAPEQGLVFDVWRGQTATMEDVTMPKTRLYMPDHNVVVVASYRPVNSEEMFAVTYDANQGVNAPVDSRQYLENAAVTVKDPGAMAREDHVFMIWNTSPDRDDARIDASEYRPEDRLAMPAGGLTLYAQWITQTERDDLVNQSCFASCHTREEFENFKLTREQWEAAIDKMIKEQGLVLDDRAHRGVVADYLAENYGPDPEPIPTLSEWGMILLTALMLVLGVGCLRRQRFAPRPAL